MQFSTTAFPAIAFLATILTTAVAHPLNLLHSHHTHHAHHHLHLRLPKLGPKAAPGLQQPLANNAPATTLDISNVFVNMTVTSPETSLPTSFLVPLRTSKQTPSVGPTTSTCHHPRTARISNIQYGTSMEQASQQFERAEDVVCYAQAKAFRLRDGEIDLAGVAGNLEEKEVVSGFTCLLES